MGYYPNEDIIPPILKVLKAVYNALIHPYLNYAVLNWAGHQRLLRIYKTKLWNFWKHPTKPLWMKYIYKITFWQSIICLKCLLVSLCTLMKTINFHYILTNISNLFWQFINTHQTCMFKKFLLTQGKLFPRAMLPQIHWTQGMVRNTWPCQISILLWFQTSVQKLPTLWVCWCKSTKGICLNSSCMVRSLWFV